VATIPYFITCALGLLVVVPAAAQPLIPGAGLVAEGDRRWDAAVTIYREVLDREPTRAELWIRIADIEAIRGNLVVVVDALERAARITVSDPTVFTRRSRTYSEQPRAAVEAIERALALSPDSERYLEARGELATWSGQYDRAQESYRRLRHLRPSDTTVALQLARVSAWSGDINEACTMYGNDRAVWIELARAETWRGNYAAALDALDMYEALYGNTAEYRSELAEILARAGRPTSAIDLVEPLIQKHPENQSLFELVIDYCLNQGYLRDQPTFSSEAAISMLPPARRFTREVLLPLAG
jgi:tetratricopeptide (TPR) repeat protein